MYNVNKNTYLSKYCRDEVSGDNEGGSQPPKVETWFAKSTF